MTAIRVIALPTDTVKQVLSTMKSPGYGHPAHTDDATGHGPCRHCLRPFRVGEERRTLFTHNPFYKLAPIPLPGPVYIHAELCERFNEAGGYPTELLPYAAILDGYDREQRVVSQRPVTDGTQEAAIQEMFASDELQYIMVRDLGAGCFDFRVERNTEVG